IEERCGFFLRRIAPDRQLNTGQHLGVAQDHIDVVLDVPLIGKKGGSFHGLNHLGYRLPGEDLAVAFQRSPIEGGVSDQYSHDASPCVPPVSSPEIAGGRVSSPASVRGSAFGAGCSSGFTLPRLKAESPGRAAIRCLRAVLNSSP